MPTQNSEERGDRCMDLEDVFTAGVENVRRSSTTSIISRSSRESYLNDAECMHTNDDTAANHDDLWNGIGAIEGI